MIRFPKIRRLTIMATKKKADTELSTNPIIIAELGENAEAFATEPLDNGTEVAFFENPKNGKIHYYYLIDGKLFGASTILKYKPFSGEEITEEAIKDSNLQETIRVVLEELNTSVEPSKQ